MLLLLLHVQAHHKSTERELKATYSFAAGPTLVISLYRRLEYVLAFVPSVEGSSGAHLVKKSA